MWSVKETYAIFINVCPSKFEGKWGQANIFINKFQGSLARSNFWPKYGNERKQKNWQTMANPKWNTSLIGRNLWRSKLTDLLVEGITDGIPLGHRCRVGGRPSSPGKAFLLTFFLCLPHLTFRNLILILFCFFQRLVTGIFECGWFPLWGFGGRGAWLLQQSRHQNLPPLVPPPPQVQVPLVS